MALTQQDKGGDTKGKFYQGQLIVAQSGDNELTLFFCQEMPEPDGDSEDRLPVRRAATQSLVDLQRVYPAPGT